MIDAGTLARFKELIRSHCGLQSDGLGQEPLVAAIDKRVAALGLDDAPTYFARLVANEDEFQELVTLLTINETYFYREPEQLRLLTDRLMPRLLAEANGRLPIRILSAGCSSGEEPYSIAIAMLEKYGEAAARMVRILGGDIDHYALAKARAGRYGAFSFRSLDTDLRQRYFHPLAGGTMVVDDKVKAMVSFHPLNLLSRGFPPALCDLDVVFFRNVSIYFDEATRRQIQQGFAHAMCEHGHLVTGSAETLANDLGVFTLAEEDGAFFFHRKAPPRAVPAPHPVPASRPERSRAPAPLPKLPIPRPAPPEPDLDEIRSLIRDKRFDRVDLILGPRNRQGRPAADLLALEGYVRLLGRDFQTARQLGEKALAADEWSVDALVLLGLAAKWQGQLEDAAAWLKKAVYVRHECWPAHYYLADVQKSLGMMESAQRSYRVTLQQLGEVNPHPDGGLVLPLGLPAAEIRFLCERQARPARMAGR